jgi:dihydrofolate reductase
MGKVAFNTSVSLDGFVAGPNDEVDRLFEWYSSGDTDFEALGAPMRFKVSRASAELFRETWPRVGAIVTGRRTFDLAGAWGGNPPLGVPHVVVTHRVPQEWVKPGSPFTFVTDGVENAVAKAKQLAGEKDVAIGSASVMRQALQAGLLDEIDLDLVPILLGDGVRLFEGAGGQSTNLALLRVIEGTGVTHLHYRVVK